MGLKRMTVQLLLRDHYQEDYMNSGSAVGTIFAILLCARLDPQVAPEDHLPTTSRICRRFGSGEPMRA